MSILCLHFHSWPSSRLATISPGLVHDPWNGKHNCHSFVIRGDPKTPSWSGTCQSSLLIGDSFLHQQLLLRGSLRCLISFPWWHEIFVWTSYRWAPSIDRFPYWFVMSLLLSWKVVFLSYIRFSCHLATPLSSVHASEYTSHGCFIVFACLRALT